MEAQAQQNKNEGGQGSVAQPQREKRQNRQRNKPAGYYKTDVATEEAKPAQQQGSNDANQESRDHPQRQNQGAQRQGGNRGERNFQAKGQAPQNGEGNGSASQSPKENGRAKNKRGKRNNDRDEGGNKKNFQKGQEGSHDAVNERFDNSETMEKGQPTVRDPHRAHQIAEAARIQQLIPSGTMSPEVQEKIRKIREVVPQKFEEVYAALEENGFDEEKTLTSLLEGQGGQSRPAWANVVKKGTKLETPVEQPQRNNRAQQQQQQPKNANNAKFVNNAPAAQTAPRPVDNRSPVMDAFVSSGMMDPEMIVQSLTMAIQNQLQMIQEQTKMLTMMQTELTVITQSGTSERQQLLREQEDLRQRKAQLEQELHAVHHRMDEIDEALEENQKKKAEKISNITQNNMVAALLKKGSALPQLPAPESFQEQEPSPVQQQVRTGARQANYRRNYNNQHGQAS